MERKDVNTAVTIPLFLLVVGLLLKYLLDNFQTAHKFLISYLQDKYLIYLLVLSVVLLLCVLPYWFFHKSCRPITKRETEGIFNIIKDSIDAEYELHNKNVLSENYDTICEKHAYLGFDLPTGALYDDIRKLYINEIAVFADIVSKTISKATTKENASSLQPHLSKLVTEMMQSHNFRIKKEHEIASTFDYPKPFSDNFSDIADKETELQEKKIISHFKLISS